MQDLRNGLHGAATAVMVCMKVFAIFWTSVSLLFHDTIATKELCWRSREADRVRSDKDRDAWDYLVVR